MADITENNVRTYIATELASDSEIPASKHRAVENKIMDFVVQELAKVSKTKVVLLTTWTTDRNYSVGTGFSGGEEINGVQVMLLCKISNNGFSIGDVITAPTPYPQDSGRTAAQGIGLQYSQASANIIKVMVNDQITIMTAYNASPGAVANNIQFSGASTANWTIKLIIDYK